MIRPSWRWHSASPVLRLLVIGVLLAFLQIPTWMIRDVVIERQARKNDAVTDIIGKWGSAQTLVGPILRIPYSAHREARDAQGHAYDERVTKQAYFLPRTLAIGGELRTERRHRGLFEVPVYTAQLHLQGRFARPDFTGRGVSDADVDWGHAELLLALNEPRALHADAALVWAGQHVALEPSTGSAGAWPTPGIHASIGSALAAPFHEPEPAFDLTLGLNGAEDLRLAPTAEQTTLDLKGDWPHPSFQGGWLPVERQLDAHGFSARWSVSWLGRNTPQSWDESEEIARTIEQSAFGVTLATPADQYAMSDRVTKYAMLTLVLSFAVIWLTELLSTARVHFVQYGFVGLALCLFGLLQLSFAEHYGFNVAFAVAALAVVGLVTLYGRAMLGGWWRAVVLGSVLGGLYAYLYAIINAEDDSLLGGSLALFVGLAVTMWLTRRFDWSGDRAEAEIDAV